MTIHCRHLRALQTKIGLAHAHKTLHHHLGYEGPEPGASLGQGADPARRDHVAPRDVDARQLTKKREGL